MIKCDLCKTSQQRWGKKKNQAKDKRRRHFVTPLLVIGISIDWTCIGDTEYIHVCISIYRYASSDFKKSFSLYTGSQPWNRVRWNGPRGRTFRGQIRFLFPGYIFYVHPHTIARIHTKPPRTIIKKIEGEGSLLIRLANCGISPSNPSAILDPIIFQEKLHRLFPSFSLSPRSISKSLSLSLSLSSLAIYCHYFCPVNGTWTYVSLYVRMVDERGSSEVSTQKWNTFTTMAFRFPFVAWNPRNGFCDVENTSISQAFREKSRSVTHVVECLLFTLRRSGKLFRCTEKYFSEQYSTFYEEKKRHDARK